MVLNLYFFSSVILCLVSLHYSIFQTDRWPHLVETLGFTIQVLVFFLLTNYSVAFVFV